MFHVTYLLVLTPGCALEESSEDLKELGTAVSLRHPAAVAVSVRTVYVKPSAIVMKVSVQLKVTSVEVFANCTVVIVRFLRGAPDTGTKLENVTCRRFHAAAVECQMKERP
jgi:hypothetical protein